MVVVGERDYDDGIESTVVLAISIARSAFDAGNF